MVFSRALTSRQKGYNQTVEGLKARARRISRRTHEHYDRNATKQAFRLELREALETLETGDGRALLDWLCLTCGAILPYRAGQSESETKRR